MKRYLMIILGSLLIAFAYNIFFLQYNLVPDGLYGLSALLFYATEYNPAIFLVIVNVFILIVGYFCLKEKIVKYIIPSLLIPLFIYLTSFIVKYIELGSIESILIAVFGAFISGYGYSIIYKNGCNIGGIDSIQEVFDNAFTSNILYYLINLIILLTIFFILPFENVMYSLMIMIITKYMNTKSKIGISSSKTFFILTKKEEEIKNYIMQELHHDLTEFKVKGGYSNLSSKIIMTAMDTKDYYKLKEGIKLIDPQAFISVIDSYEVINKNITLSHELCKK